MHCIVYYNTFIGRQDKESAMLPFPDNQNACTVKCARSGGILVNVSMCARDVFLRKNLA